VVLSTILIAAVGANVVSVQFLHSPVLEEHPATEMEAIASKMIRQRLMLFRGIIGVKIFVFNSIFGKIYKSCVQTGLKLVNHFKIQNYKMNICGSYKYCAMIAHKLVLTIPFAFFCVW